RLGRLVAQPVERLVDLQRVLADVRRPAPAPGGDVDRHAGPSRRGGERGGVQVGETQRPLVEHGIESGADLGDGAGALGGPGWPLPGEGRTSPRRYTVPSTWP